MGKQRRSAEQLRAKVQVQLNAIPEVATLVNLKPKAGPIAGDVYAHHRDEAGRNWDIEDLYKGAGYAKAFRPIVNGLRYEYHFWESFVEASWWIRPNRWTRPAWPRRLPYPALRVTLR